MAKGRTARVTKQGVDAMTDIVDKFAHAETDAKYNKDKLWERNARCERQGMILLATKLGVRCGCRTMFSAEHGRREIHCTCRTTIKARNAELNRLTREHERQ